MAFPTDWGRRCVVTIQASKISANLTDYPLLLTEDTLPSEMFDADGLYPALNGGGDIRFSSDEAGSVQLPLEVVSFITDNNPANGVAQLWVKVPSVSSSTDTDIYVWYNKSGETQPARDNAYGSDNVWSSEYEMIQHMNGADYTEIDDSTVNANDVNGQGGTPVFNQSGKIGNAVTFVPKEHLKVPASTSINMGANSFTFSAWINTNDAPERQAILGRSLFTSGNFYVFELNGSKLRIAIKDGTTQTAVGGTTVLSASTWYLVSVVRDYQNDLYLYVNGVQDGTISDSSSDISNNDEIEVAGWVHQAAQADGYFDGELDEVRMGKTVIDPSVLLADYNSQNDPATFAIEGTPETPTAGETLEAEVGSFSLTGIATNFIKGKNLIASVGAFVLTGIAVNFKKGLGMLAEVGAFALSGIDVGFSRATKMLASAGSFILSGTDAGLRLGLGMIARVGEFTLTGINVLLLVKETSAYKKIYQVQQFVRSFIIKLKG